MTELKMTIADGDHEQLAGRINDWLLAFEAMHQPQRREGDLWSSSEQLVLHEGHRFDANIWEMTVDDLAPGKCFHNAFILSQINPRWRYFEGWALMPFSLPTHHAWVVDEDDVVQDPTWKPLYRSYRDRSAAQGSPQPYSGLVSYLGVSVDPVHHLHWTLSRGEPNILSVGEMDVREVRKHGVATALHRHAADLGLATYP